MGNDVKAVVEIADKPVEGIGEVVDGASVHNADGEKVLAMELVDELSDVLFAADYNVFLIHGSIVIVKERFGN